MLVDFQTPLIFFGGSRGGGKTDGVLGKWAIKAKKYGINFNGILFRRELPMLDDAIARSQQFYPKLGAKWQDQKKTWTFASGGRIRFRPLRVVMDADKYQGQNLSDICVEEAGQYPDPSPIDRLWGALRSSAGIPTQMILTGNPGGAGQFWIKQRHIDPCPMGLRLKWLELSHGIKIRWLFIPSKLKQNKILMQSDPQYESRLHLVGNDKLVQAWLNGDWNAVEGAFFEEWVQELHVIKPFRIPSYWTRFRAFDWGSAAPFSVGWFAVSDGTIPRYPRGALIMYREWYGASRPNVGLKLTTEEVARGIIKRDCEEKIEYSVADPSIFARDGGPSRAEIFSQRGVFFRRADNRRLSEGRGHLGGWDEVRNRLKGNKDGIPMIFFYNTCTDTIRTIPVLQHDRSRPEDLDTNSEDHAADMVRYGCMSRPWVADYPMPPRSNEWAEDNKQEHGAAYG